MGCFSKKMFAKQNKSTDAAASGVADKVKGQAMEAAQPVVEQKEDEITAAVEEKVFELTGGPATEAAEAVEAETEE